MSGKLGTDFVVTDPTDASSPTLGASWDRNTKAAVKSWATTEHDGEGAHKFQVVASTGVIAGSPVAGSLAIVEAPVDGSGDDEIRLTLTFTSGTMQSPITITAAGLAYAVNDYLFVIGNGKTTYDTTICVLRVATVSAVGAVTSLVVIRGGSGYTNGTFTLLTTAYKPQPILHEYNGSEWWPLNQPPSIGSFSSVISAGSITSTQIASQTIVEGNIADGAITSNKILDGTILNADIADGTITAAKLSSGVLMQVQDYRDLLMYVNGTSAGSGLTVSWNGSSVTVAAGGVGWSIGDYALVNDAGLGNGNMIVKVTGVGGGGDATTLELINAGTGYATTGTGEPCVAILAELKLNFSEILMQDIAGTVAKRLGAVSNMTINFGSLFANGTYGGIDSGSPPALASTTFYYVWAIYNPTTEAVSAILTITPPPGGPTFPSGFSYGVYIGAVWYQASGGFQGLIQHGKVAQCDVNTFPAVSYSAYLTVFKATPTVPISTAFVHLATSTAGTLFTYGSNGNYIDGQRVAMNKANDYYCTVNTTHYICGWEYA